MSPSGSATKRFFTTIQVFARRIVGGHQLRAQAQLAAELGSRRFFGQERVGTQLQHGALYGLRSQHAAQPRLGLVKRVFRRLTGGPCFLKLEGRSQTRDAAANDANTHSCHYPTWKIAGAPNVVGEVRDFELVGAGAHYHQHGAWDSAQDVI